MDMHNTDPFSMSFDYASGKIGERFQNPLWPITEIFFGGQFRRSIDKVKDFGTVIVENAIKARKAKSSAPSPVPGADESLDAISGSLINSLLDSISNHRIVADAALNYLSAGASPSLHSHPANASKAETPQRKP